MSCDFPFNYDEAVAFFQKDGKTILPQDFGKYDSLLKAACTELEKESNGDSETRLNYLAAKLLEGGDSEMTTIWRFMFESYTFITHNK